MENLKKTKYMVYSYAFHIMVSINFELRPLTFVEWLKEDFNSPTSTMKTINSWTWK